jgi:hypothetical protein
MNKIVLNQYGRIVIFLFVLNVSLQNQAFSQWGPPKIEQNEMQKYVLNLNLFSANFGIPVLNFYSGIGGRYNLSDKISFTGEFNFSLWDMKKYILKATKDDKNTLRSSKDYSLGFEMNLFKWKIKPVSKKLVFSTEGNSYQTTTYYRDYEFKDTVMLIFRGGISNYNSNVRPTKRNSKDYKKGTSVLDLAYIKSSDGHIINEYNPSAVHVFAVYAGLGWKTKENYQVAWRDLPTRRANIRYFNLLYLDAMIAPAIVIADVISDNTYKVNNSYKKQHLGIRFGMTRYRINNAKSSMYVNWEAGVLPGVGVLPLYWKFTIGMVLDFKKYEDRLKFD